MILINGDSFTQCYNLKNPNNSWPIQLSNLLEHPVTNLALGGASNDRIYRTTKEYLITNTKPNHVIIGWTFHDRNEIFHHEGLYIRGLNTGSQSEIEYSPLDINNIHKNWINFNLNVWINYRNWVYNILFLQNYFKSNGINYTFFTACESSLIYEFLNGTDRALMLADQAWQWRDKKKYKAERTIHDQYKELVELCRLIDLNNWILPKSSMADYLDQKGYKRDQTQHFYADGYAAWANFMVDKVFNK